MQNQVPGVIWNNGLKAQRAHSPRRTRIKDTNPCDLQSRDACPCDLLILYPCGSTPARVLQYLGGSTAVLWAEYWCNPRQSTVVLSTEYCVNHTNWCSPHNSYVLLTVKLWQPHVIGVTDACNISESIVEDVWLVGRRSLAIASI